MAKYYVLDPNVLSGYAVAGPFASVYKAREYIRNQTASAIDRNDVSVRRDTKFADPSLIVKYVQTVHPIPVVDVKWRVELKTAKGE